METKKLLVPELFHWFLFYMLNYYLWKSKNCEKQLVAFIQHEKYWEKQIDII